MIRRLAAIAGLALAVSGCAAEAPPVPTPSVTPVIVTSSTQPPNPREREAKFNADVIGTELHKGGRDTALDLGYTICAALGRGVSVDHVMELSVDNGFSYADSKTVVDAARNDLCPERS